MKKTAFTLIIYIGYLCCINAQPSVLWQKCLGGDNYDEAYAIQQTNDDGYIIAGRTNSNSHDVSGNHGSYDYWVVKLDSIGNIQWQKCLGGTNADQAYSVKQTNDGGYIVAGYTNSTDGNISGNHGNDYWIVKLDSSGSILWQKCLGGSGTDWAYSIILTNDSGYIVVGLSNSTNGDVIGNHGSSDYWIVKLDSGGNLQWQKSYGGSLNEGSYNSPSDIYQTSDNGYIFCGSTNSNNGDVSGNHDITGTYSDCWVVKLDTIGNIQWQKCLGGSNTDMAYSIKQTIDGGYIIAGYTNSTNGDVSGKHVGVDDIWVMKLSSAGILQWQKCIGGSANEYAYSIQQINDGGYILAGTTASHDGDILGIHTYTGGTDYCLAKLDSVGDIIWGKCYGGSSGDLAASVQQTEEGGYIVAGYSSSGNGDVSGQHGGNDFWVAKLCEMYASITGISNISCSGCNDGSATVNAFGGYPPYSYEWNTTPTQFTPTATGLTLLQLNNYYIVTVTDSTGCWDTARVYLNLVTEIGDYLTNMKYNIFPTITTDKITVEIPEKSEIEILNIDGRIIKSIISDGNHICIDVSGYAKGMYFVKAKTDNGLSVKKFIKN
jgi:hypothetical protein